MARLLILSLLFTTQAFAQYQNDAVDQALDSYFAEVQSTSRIIYTETDQAFCSLNAELEVVAKRNGTSRLERFECDICLYADDNLFWDYESMSCEFAAH